MSTLATFSSLLNDYLHYELLAEEMKRQNWLIGKVAKDNNWRGGPLIIPFEGAEASTIVHGYMAAESDITEFEYVRGQVDTYKECWGSMVWNAKDLWENVPTAAREKGYVNKQSFLKNLLGQQKKFVEKMKEAASLQLLAGGAFCTLTADSTANDGVITVDRPERLTRGQKIVVDDDNSTAQTMWVKTININTKSAVCVTAKGGSTVFDFTAASMTVAQNAKVYREGADTASNNFTSLRSQLLSAANGGTSTLFGQTKLTYPHLQAINVDGSAITQTSVLEGIFDGWTTIKTYGKGNATDAVVSFVWLGHIMKALEAGSGAYRHVSTKVTAFGYTEIEIQGVEGMLRVVGVREMDNDLIYFIDWDAMKFHSNGFFEKHVDPDGKQYHTVRTAGANGGYKYICDIRLFGELAVHTPAWCGVLYGCDPTNT